MKKLIMILALVTSSFAVFASEVNVNNAVLNAFNQEFKAATDIKWTNSGENLYKASFLYNGQHLSAFYSAEGELIGTTRNVSSLDLPIILQTKLRNEYDGYWISNLFEYSTKNGTSYFITVENAGSKKVLQSYGNDWVTFKKAAKI